MSAQVLCVSCRAGTPAGDPNTPVICRTCGVSLPQPGTRAWRVSRGDAQFGPYTFAELATYVGEGRILPDDNVWHDGAAVQVPVNQLPLAPAAPAITAPPGTAPGAAAGAAPTVILPGKPSFDANALVGRVRREVTRALNWNLATVPVEPDEEAKLIANGVDEEDARRYLVWRRSVLLVVAFPTVLSGLLATIEFLGRDNSGLSGLGILLELLRIAALFALPATAWFAARCWDQHRRSRQILLYGWLAAFLTPLLLALFPFSWRVDMSGGDPNLVSQMSGLLGLVGAIAVYVTLMPAVLSLIPGVMRACLRIKTLIPESILPGIFLIAATPLYVLLFLVIFTTVNQLAGSLLLILAVLALLGAPLLYMLNAGIFIRPLRTPEEVAKVGQVQKLVLIAGAVGVGLLVLYAFSSSMMGRSLIGMSDRTSLMRPWSLAVIQFPIEYFLRSLFTTALVADLIMQLNLALWRHTQAFQAMPEAQAYDRLMSEIEEAGGDAQPTVVQPAAGSGPV